MFQSAAKKSNQVKPEIAVIKFINNYILLSRFGEILYFAFVNSFGGVPELFGEASLDFNKYDSVFFSDNQIDFLMSGPPVLLNYSVTFIEQIF